MANSNNGPVLQWENIETVRESRGLLDSRYLLERAKVPGGWFVISQFKIGSSHRMVFLPDPRHEWDGAGLP